MTNLTDNDAFQPLENRFKSDLDDGLTAIRGLTPGVTIFGSARFAENHGYYQMAMRLGQKLASNGHSVITGGGPGIMEAANRGAFEADGESVGLNIHLETEQDLNPYCTSSHEFHYFFARKVMMTLAAKVYVFFPGGFGTLDEFSEILELKHTGKISPDTPIFCVGRDFWQGLDKWFAGPMSELHLIETGEAGEFKETNGGHNDAIKSARELYTLTDDLDAIVAAADNLEPATFDSKFERFSSNNFGAQKEPSA